MLVSEFISRTGYQPTAEEYATIEQEYMNFDGNKDEFCKQWCYYNPTKAGSIQRAIKEATIRDAEERKVINRVMRYVYSKHSEKPTVETLDKIIKGVRREVAKKIIFSLRDWCGYTSNWSSYQWGNYWDIHSLVCYYM